MLPVYPRPPESKKDLRGRAITQIVHHRPLFTTSWIRAYNKLVPNTGKQCQKGKSKRALA